MKRGLLTLIALTVLCGSALAAPPTLEAVFPPGGQLGSEVEVKLLGKFDPWPASVWFSKPGVTFTPDPAKAGMGKIKIDQSVPAGPLLMRVFNETGVSKEAIFIVGSTAEIVEEDKNENTISKAVPIDRKALPLVVNGTVSTTGELDSYRVALKEGETLYASVEGYGLRSPIDPAIHVHDAEGHRLFLVHDGPTNLDPGFAFAVPATGEYVISLVSFSHPPTVNVGYVGSRNSIYRLYLGLKEGDIPARLRPQALGADSAESIIQPQKAIVGTLKTSGAINRYSITAKKGEVHFVKVEGNTLGFPIDPVLTILKPDGTLLRREDDTAGSRDPSYLWTVAADGEYTITVNDRFSRGGDSLRYRLTLTPPQGDFLLTCDKSDYLSNTGAEIEIKATLKRLYGLKGDLKVVAKGLPEGVSLKTPDSFPEKDGEFVLKLVVTDKAEAFSGPFSLLATVQQDEKKKVEHPIAFSFKTDAYRGPYAVNEHSDLWLTVVKPAKAKADKAPEKK